MPALTQPTQQSEQAATRLLALGAGAILLVTFDSSAAFAAFPALRQHFADATPAALSWTLNAYGIVYAALLLPLGRWGDQHGRRRALLGGVAIFSFGAFAGALAPYETSLIVARAIQACGAALLTPAAAALVLQDEAPAKRAAAMGMLGAAGALGAALGPALGSTLIELVSWRAIFGVNLLLGGWLFWRAARLPPDPVIAGPAVASDWVGSALLIPGVGALVATALLANSQPAQALVFGTASIALLAAFCRRAGERPESVLDLSLFKSRAFRFASLGTLVFGAAFGLMFFSSFLFLTGLWRYGQTNAGLVAAVGPLLVAPFSVIGGRWARRVGYRRVLLTGGALFALGQTWYLLRLEPAPDYFGVWLPGQLTTAAAIGLVLPSLAGVAVDGLPGHALGAGNAVNTALRQLASVFGVALGVKLVGHTEARLIDFQIVYALLAAAGLLTALFAWLLGAPPRPLNT